jgi:hypothetical protein
MKRGYTLALPPGFFDGGLAGLEKDGAAGNANQASALYYHLTTN